MSASLITEEMRSWIGRSEEISPIEISRREIVKYSLATEQRSETYLSGDEAPPMFLFGVLRPLVPLEELQRDGLFADALLPELPLPRVMAGGTKIRYFRLVRPGDTLHGRRELVDMYEKHGSKGPLIFIVYKLTVETAAGEPVIEETQTRIAR